MVHINNLQGLFGNKLSGRGRVFVIFETKPEKDSVYPKRWKKESDRLTWEEAISYIEKQGSSTLHVAMVLNGDGWVCIDGDKILDESGKIKPEWSHVGDELDSISISEVSVSGTGVHWFCKSDSVQFKSHATDQLDDHSHLDGWNGLRADRTIAGRCVILTGKPYKGVGSHFHIPHHEVVDDFVANTFTKGAECKLAKEDGKRVFKPVKELTVPSRDDWDKGIRYIDKIVREEGCFPEGQRNERMFRLTGNLRRHVADEQVLHSLAATANDRLCSPPMCDKELRKVTDNSGDNGRPRNYECDVLDGIFQPRIDPISSEIIQQFNEVAKEQAAKSDYKFKTDMGSLYAEEGIIGEVMRYAAEVRPHFRMPQADLCTALFAMATLCCGRFRTGRDEGNTWPNLYGVYVTTSGIGKDTNKQVIGAVAQQAGIEDRLSRTNISSAQGWIKSFSFEIEGGQPWQTQILDEWADMLPQHGRQPSELWQHVMRYLKDYYQTCGRGLITPSSRVDDTLNFKIKDISPTILGLTQPKVWQRISPEMLGDGFAGRHLFFGDSVRGSGSDMLKPRDLTAAIYKNAYGSSDLPESLKQMIKTLTRIEFSRGMDYCPVPFEYEARKWFNTKVREMNESFVNNNEEESDMDSMERRSFDKITRLAVLIAVSEDVGVRVRTGKGADPFDQIQVLVHHVELAWSIVMDCVEFAKHCVKSHSKHEDCLIADKVMTEVLAKVEKKLESNPEAEPFVYRSKVNALKGIKSQQQRDVLTYIADNNDALIDKAKIIPAKYVESYQNLKTKKGN